MRLLGPVLLLLLAATAAEAQTIEGFWQDSEAAFCLRPSCARLLPVRRLDGARSAADLSIGEANPQLGRPL